MRVIDDRERRARLATRHALAPGHGVGSFEEAVAAMTCLHATEPANVYLSAFARSGVTRDDIDRALYEDRTVVRQLAMRRTVFALPSDLLPAVLASASARVAGQLVPRLAKEVEMGEVTDDGAAWYERLRADVIAHVATEATTTARLREHVPALAERVDRAPGKRWGGLAPVASQAMAALNASGAVLRGANDGVWRISRPVWTSYEEWFDEPLPEIDERAGYAELVRRWLWTFGPGTEADVVWWLGATKAAVRTALADVSAVEVALEDGTPAWLHPDDTETVEPVGPWAALLPALDPTTMGWKGRDFYLGQHAERIFDKNGNGGPTAWWDGRIVGGWTQDEDGVVVVIEAEELPKRARQALATKAEELTAWLDGEVVRSSWQSPLVREREGR